MVERFSQAGISPERIACEKDTFTFKAPFSPTHFMHLFRDFYGPSMNAFEAAKSNGKAADLERELTDLFNSHNQATSPDSLQISATYLRVTVSC